MGIVFPVPPTNMTYMEMLGWWLEILKHLKGLTGTITWNPASLADGAGETSNMIFVNGAALGDYVQVAAPYDLQGIMAFGWVEDTNQVRIRIQNETGNTINLASGTWKVKVGS